MLDLGTEDPEVARALTQAITIMHEHVTPLMQRESFFTRLSETSEVYRLLHATGVSPLNLETVLRMAIDSTNTALKQIAYFLEDTSRVDRITLQSLLRVAILGTARTAFVLLPTDPAKRLENAKIVIAQDCQSGIRGIRQYVEFKGMPAMAPHPEVLEDLRKQKAELYPSGRLPGETTIIARQTEALIEALHAAGVDKDSSTDIMRDHASWLWNTYSGMAHANSWPLLLPRISTDPRIPGDFPIDFYMTVTAFHVAVLAYFDRTQPGSESTTAHVNTTPD
jgi:hypothetical protein